MNFPLVKKTQFNRSLKTSAIPDDEMNAPPSHWVVVLPIMGLLPVLWRHHCAGTETRESEAMSESSCHPRAAMCLRAVRLRSDSAVKDRQAQHNIQAAVMKISRQIGGVPVNAKLIYTA